MVNKREKRRDESITPYYSSNGTLPGYIKLAINTSWIGLFLYIQTLATLHTGLFTCWKRRGGVSQTYPFTQSSLYYTHFQPLSDDLGGEGESRSRDKDMDEPMEVEGGVKGGRAGVCVLNTKVNPVVDDYFISNNVLGLGINGKVVECFSKKDNKKYALKVITDSCLFWPH